MRYQPWRKPLHLRAQRTPMKFFKSLGFNSTFSRFYNAAKQKSLEARKQQLEKRKTYASENRIIKRTKEERDKKDRIHTFVELSRKYDVLRAEQMNLERQIKRRTAVLIKAVYRHKQSTKILGELERILTKYSEQLEKAFSNNILRAIGHSLNAENRESNYNKLNITRTMGGSDFPYQYNADLMPTFVKKFTIMRNYAKRWMEKAHIKKRRSTFDLTTLIKRQQRLSWEPFREAITMQIKEPIMPKLNNAQNEREVLLRAPSATSFHDTSSLRNQQKRTGSLRSLLAPSQVVASEEGSKLAKRTKKLKNKRSATSDIDDNARRQRTGKRRGRGRRRSSRKSQQSTTSDRFKKGQRKRKSRRKSTKTLDTTDQDVKEGKSARKGRKRRSKDKQRLSKISRESGNRAGQLQLANDANTTKENNMFDAVKHMVAVQTAVDQFKSKVVEFDNTQPETQQQFSELEEYWGVPLRENYTLRKLEHLNSILDELIVKEKKKPQSRPQSRPLSTHPSKQVLTARKVIAKPRKREMHDLEKLLILLKECKKCQKMQKKTKTSGSDCTVLCQREYYDAIRNAAGLPDYFPDDSDFSLICSCNSVI